MLNFKQSLAILKKKRILLYMTSLSLDGNLTLTVQSKTIPVRFYDNIIEVQLNHLSLIRPCIQFLQALLRLPLNINTYRKSVKIKITSDNIMIKVLGKIAGFFV